MNKIGWPLLGIFALFTLVGCLQSNTVIKLNPDGSGTIEESVMMSKAAIKQMEGMANSMMEQMASGMGQVEQKEDKTEQEQNGFNIFDETKLVKKANDMGEGVTYLSGEKVSNDKFEGYKAIYSFSDINKLSINQNPGKNASLDQERNAVMPEKKREDIRFHFTRGEPSELTIRMPRTKNEKKAEQSKPDITECAQVNDQQVEMMNQMKKMFEDMKITMSIEVQGEIIETNATHREGSRITLMEMDFGKLLQLPEHFKEFVQANVTSLMDAKTLLKNIPGIKVDLNKEITLKIKNKLGVTSNVEKQKPIFKKPFQEDKPVTSKNAKPHNVIDHSSDKGNFIQFYNKGIEFYKQGKYDQAEKEFEKALELKPDDVYALYGLGNTYYFKAKYDDAVKVYTKAININPDYAKLHYSLSLTYNKLGMTREAEKEKTIFRKLSPARDRTSQKDTKQHNDINHSPTTFKFSKFYNKGIEFYKLGNYDQAEKEFKKAIELDPDDFHAFYYLGNTYYYKAKYEDAVNVYTKTINVNPDYAKVHYSLSLAYSKLGMTLEAEKEKSIFRKLSQGDGSIQNHTKLSTVTDHSTGRDNSGSYFNQCVVFYKTIFKKLFQREGEKPPQKHAKPYNGDDHSAKVALQKAVTSGNQIGQTLINSVFDDQDGQPQSLLNIINGKKGFIYFYSGGCGHCKEQLIKVSDFVKQFNEDTIAIVGIQYMGGETCSLTEQSLHEIKGMRIADAGGKICGQYGVGDFTLIVSGKNSVIRYRGEMNNINEIKKSLSLKYSEKYVKPYNGDGHSPVNGNFTQLYNKGIEFYKQGKYDQSGKEFEKALELKPNDVYALYGLGNTYYCKAKYEDAVTVYTKAININPDYAKVHYSLSLTYGKLGMTHEREKEKAMFRIISQGDGVKKKHSKPHKGVDHSTKAALQKCKHLRTHSTQEEKTDTTRPQCKHIKKYVDIHTTDATNKQ